LVAEPESAEVDVVATEEEEGLDALATMAVQLVEAETSEQIEAAETTVLSDTVAAGGTAPEVSDVDLDPALSDTDVDEAGTEAGAPHTAPDRMSDRVEEEPADGLTNESERTPTQDGELATLTPTPTPDSNGEVHEPSNARDGKETALSGHGTG
jgi:hypothetical protein